MIDTKRRRVIYLSDQEWADIRRWAGEQGLTGSAFIRQAVASLRTHHVEPDEINVAIARVEQKERDRILRRISKSE